MKIIGISGSNRKGSYNAGLLRATHSLLPGDATMQILDISEWPMFSHESEEQGVPAIIADAKLEIRSADGVIIATPEHNYSIPAALKSALDWISRKPVQPLGSKPVLIVGASPGAFGSLRAQLHLRDILHSIGANVFAQPQLLVSNAREKFSADGELIDKKTREVYQTLLEGWTSSISK